jgi:hypothetical protein
MEEKKSAHDVQYFALLSVIEQAGSRNTKPLASARLTSGSFGAIVSQ